MRTLTGILLCLLVGCTTATNRMSPATERARQEAPPAMPDNPPLRSPTHPAPVVPAGSTPHVTFQPDVRVSASAGAYDEVTILWPRVIPSAGAATLNPQSIALQDYLKLIVGTELVGRTQNVRPSPERVCPQAGCKGVSVGVLLVHAQGGCAAVALVSSPGRSAAHMVPWVGTVTLKRQMIRFRDPPESAVIIRDFVPCGELGRRLSERENDIRQAIRQVATPAR